MNRQVVLNEAQARALLNIDGRRVARIAELEGTLDRVRSLHQQVDDPIDFTGEIVEGCSTCGEGWPCATTLALDGTPA